MKGFIQFIATIAAIALIVGAIALIYKYTDGFNEDFKTFYVEYDGKQILTKETKLNFAPNNVYKFDVKYTFEKEGDEPKDYFVKVVPNITKDFEYTVGGDKYKYSRLEDLSDAFSLKKDKSSFTVTIDEGLTMQTAISRAHGDRAVELPSSAYAENEYPFRLEISSYNKEITYSIIFNVLGGEVTGVTLDPDTIVFGGN